MSEGYELIITEKPKVSQRIAQALGSGKVTQEKSGKVSYYKIQRNSKQIVIAPAVGHMFTLKEEKGKKGYPIFDIHWIPSYEAHKNAKFTKPYIAVIKKLAKNATEYVNACDYDIEGSLIGYNVLKFICGEDSVKNAKRMKFSSLTQEELENAYNTKFEHLDFPMIDAGIARHIMDWYWGQNTSRALSSSYKSVTGRYLTLSAGRVQTPTLKVLDEREKEIQKFKPEPFWVILAQISADGKSFEAVHEKGDIFDKGLAQGIYNKCKDKNALIESIKKTKSKHNPPTPFNLGDLQSEAYKLFKYTPHRTQIIAQNLYEQGLISYPRTSSQKLPAGVKPRGLISKLAKIAGYEELAGKLLGEKTLKPNEGKKTDTAHPCIYPTGEQPKKLGGSDKHLYDLIVKRFFSIFGKPAIRETQVIKLDIAGEFFLARGARTIEKNWHEFYEPYARLEEVELPELKEKEEIDISKLDLLDKETKPPHRYNPASIIRKMEQLGIGTKATRATILQTLHDRNYIVGTQITVTTFGSMIVKTLVQYAPELTSEHLTREFEEEVENIKHGKQTKEAVIEQAQHTLEKIMQGFKKHAAEIGEKIKEEYQITEKEQRTLAPCPECKKGELIIRVSRASHKQFIGCSAYPKCHCGYPLPQHAFIAKTGKNCEHDGLPIIEVRRKGRRSFKMCIDPKCPSKADWGKKKKVEK